MAGWTSSSKAPWTTWWGLSSISSIRFHSSASPTPGIFGIPPWTANTPSFAARARRYATTGSISWPTRGIGSWSRISTSTAARSVALEEIEYVNYIEHPGAPIELSVEKHGYDVYWFNPATGEYLEQKKYRGEHFTGQAPDSSHPWVLLVGREGRKESMLKSVKFDSRDVPVQELETNTQKVPYAIVEPAGDTLQAGKPVRFSVKLTRETRATRSMMYLWTGEVAADGRGFRVLGTGAPGTFVIPPTIATNFPAVLSIHLTALNANGKAYAADQVYQLTK